MDIFSDLTPKQALFCDEYFKDFNATKAALRAGYSPATALSGNLMLLPKIKYHLQQRGAEAAEKAQVTHQMLLAELKTVGFARMSHFFGADGKPKDMNEVNEDTKAALLNYTVTEDKNGTTTIKIRMNNKLSALDKIAKHLKFYDAEHPAHDVKYWILDGPSLDEQDRYDEDSFAKKEAEQEAEIDKRVAEAVAATEERMKAEFELKLKKMKKKAKKKLKNTHEYPRLEENQEARIKSRDEGEAVILEQGHVAVEKNQEATIKSQDEEKMNVGEQGKMVIGERGAQARRTPDTGRYMGRDKTRYVNGY
jgi:phage terminase small subunit